MNIWLIILLVFVVVAFVFFLSSIPHRIGYIVFFVWFCSFGSRSMTVKINSILDQHNILNTLYIPIFLLLLVYCIIGIIEALIRIFNGNFTFGKFILDSYETHKRIKELEKQGRRPGQLDLYSLFPQLKNSNEYEYIFNQCRNAEEKEQFSEDWSSYLVDLQSYVYLGLQDNSEKKSEDLYFSFDEWYRMNEVWRRTGYYHDYYNEQHEEKYRKRNEINKENGECKDEKDITQNLNIVIPAGDKNIEEMLSDLNNMIGLDNVKKEINNLIQLEKYQRLREQQGLKKNSGDGTNHLVFAGNPGTGKTTVARMLASIYKELGVISTGQLIEVDRSGLIGRYLGETAQIVHSVIQKSIGGILFIDEAYSLYHDGMASGDAYGQEAIDVLLKEMEDYRDNLVIIAAGYTDRMEEFLKRNPGLKSRFKTTIHFDDYSPEEMLLIYKDYCIKDENILSSEAELKLQVFFSKIYSEKDENFGNGRTVRGIYNATIQEMGKRVSSINSPTIDDLRTILPEDVSFDYRQYV